ncbi:MAG: hypothetical protein DRI65_01810 [Chloroflexota bacterium]|nr:MAG: hypothetical protein DRI65_01810 [Chloroflexota bacterium]
MTTYSDNLRIPHLDQNVAQPEVPENTAKNIIDSILSNVYILQTVDANDITISHTDSVVDSTDWQSFMIEIRDSGAYLTDAINVNLPDNPRPYVFKNSTSYSVNFKTTGGTGVTLTAGSNAYCFSDGVNIVRLEFAATGAGADFLTLNDTPISYTGSELKIASVNSSGNALVFTDSPMIWKGAWVDATYILNDVVRDGAWTMIANTETTDRAAPQNIGDVLDAIDPNASPTTGSNMSTVKMVHRYTMTKSGYLKSISLRAPSWTSDSVTKATLVNISSGESETIDDPVLSTEDEWVTVTIGTAIAVVGNIYEIWFEYYNSTSASNISGEWNSELSSGDPSSKAVAIDVMTNPTRVAFSHTDIGNNGHATELDAVAIGSIITVMETNDNTRSFTCEVSAISTAPASSTTYTVINVQNGAEDVRDGMACACDIDIPIAVASDYTLFADLWDTPAGFATITSELWYDGVQQADVNDGYGINLAFQEASVSPDWDLMALSSEGVGGGGSSFGDVLVGVTIQNYGEVLNAIAGTSGAQDIDLSFGNVVTLTVTGAMTLTFTTIHDNTSFTLLVTDAGANITWPTIKWEGGVEPTWSSAGDDLVTFTKIGSVWIGGALIGVA